MRTDSIAPVGLGSRSIAAGAALLPWFQFAAAGSVGGATLAALDYGRLAASSQPLRQTWPEHLSHVSLMIVAGYLAGLFGALLLQLCCDLGGWVATRWNISRRLAISAAIATASLVVIVPVGIALFQGRGISQTSVAGWGPWAVSVTGWVLCAAAAWLVQRLHQSLEAQQRPWLLRAAIAVGAALLLAPLVYADLYLFYGLYGYVHAVLMASSFAIVAVVSHLLLGAWRDAAARLAAGAALACVPLFVYAAPRYDAALADFATHFAYTSRMITAARHVTDWDDDGYSNILGHKDAAVFDRRIRPLAADLPDNGTDEDGVFGDLSRADLDAARQGHARGQSEDARARYRALSGGKPQSLLMITIDTLRADRVIPDSASDPAPFADFKRNSVRFERAFASSSYTQASVTMMATSRYDTARATASLFDALHDAGCTTLLAFAETPFKILDTSRPNVVQSFDRRSVIPDREPGDLGAFHSYVATRPTSEAIIAEALELLEAHRDRRTCTWVYLFDVHQWQQLHDPEVVGSTSPEGPDRYDNAVAYTLKHVSHLLDGLDRLGLADDTVVALSGDHGEALGEKGIVGHTRWVHNPFLHVPLVIRALGVEPGVVRDTEVGLIDVAPTLLDLLGTEPALPDIDGTSLLPLMFGQPLQHVVFAHEESYDAVFGGGHKLVADRAEGRYRLYDLCDDYAEERSLFGAPEHESVARQLYHAYQAGGLVAR